MPVEVIVDLAVDGLGLAHEYPDAPEIRHAQLLAGIQGASDLLHAYQAWAARLPRP